MYEYLNSNVQPSDWAQGARIGVMRETIDPATADPAIMDLFETALEQMAASGMSAISSCWMPRAVQSFV